MLLAQIFCLFFNHIEYCQFIENNATIITLLMSMVIMQEEFRVCVPKNHFQLVYL